MLSSRQISPYFDGADLEGDVATLKKLGRLWLLLAVMRQNSLGYKLWGYWGILLEAKSKDDIK